MFLAFRDEWSVTVLRGCRVHGWTKFRAGEDF